MENHMVPFSGASVAHARRDKEGESACENSSQLTGDRMVDEFGGRGLRIPSMQLELFVPQGSAFTAAASVGRSATRAFRNPITLSKGDPLQ